MDKKIFTILCPQNLSKSGPIWKPFFFFFFSSFFPTSDPRALASPPLSISYRSCVFFAVNNHKNYLGWLMTFWCISQPVWSWATTSKMPLKWHFASQPKVPSFYMTTGIVLSCQPRVTVASRFVYKVILNLSSIDHLCINPIHSKRRPNFF